MPRRPQPSKYDVLSFRLLVDGKETPDQLAIQSVHIERRLGDVPRASVVVRLPVDRLEKVLANQPFQPGRSIEIELGWDKKRERQFKGMIASYSLDLQPGGGAQLRVLCYDEAIRLTDGTGEASFQDSKDAEVVEQIVRESGLNVTAAATDSLRAWVRQSGLTRWNFLRRLAARNQHLLYAEDGEVITAAPALGSAPELELHLGDDLLAFSGSSSPVLQPSDAATVQHHGSATLMGEGRLRLNTLVRLAGVGPLFSRDHLITGVMHNVAEGMWRTTITFGLPPDYFADELAATNPSLAEYLQYDEETQSLRLHTPAGNQLLLSDQDEQLVLQDQHGNQLVMKASGIELNSTKDIAQKAHGELTLEGMQAELKATGGKLQLEGISVEAKAQTQFSAEGVASAELSSSGQTTVKGAMVMIN